VSVCNTLLGSTFHGVYVVRNDDISVVRGKFEDLVIACCGKAELGGGVNFDGRFDPSNCEHNFESQILIGQIA
jgi:hypothetical protein